LLYSGEKLVSDIKERTVAEGVRAQAAEGDTVFGPKREEVKGDGTAQNCVMRKEVHGFGPRQIPF